MAYGSSWIFPFFIAPNPEPNDTPQQIHARSCFKAAYVDLHIASYILQKGKENEQESKPRITFWRWPPATP